MLRFTHRKIVTLQSAII